MGFLLYFLIPSVVLGWGFGGLEFGSCAFTREDAITCFRKYVDTNHNGSIDKHELDAAIKKYGGSVINGARTAMSWMPSFMKIDLSAATIIKNCDYDHDGKFTPDDFRKSKHTCLPTQWNLCQVKGACDRAAEAAEAAAKKVVIPRKMK
jgi:hypothetical protein